MKLYLFRKETNALTNKTVKPINSYFQKEHKKEYCSKVLQEP